MPGGAGGFEDGKLDAAALAPLVRDMLGFPLPETIEQPVELGSIALSEPRVVAPPGAPWSVDPRDRIEHAYGRSFPDTVRAFRGRIDHPPDAVAFARTEEDVEAVLEWAAAEDVAVIPFGGGTSGSAASSRVCRATDSAWSRSTCRGSIKL